MQDNDLQGLSLDAFAERSFDEVSLNDNPFAAKSLPALMSLGLQFERLRLDRMRFSLEEFANSCRRSVISIATEQDAEDRPWVSFRMHVNHRPAFSVTLPIKITDNEAAVISGLKTVQYLEFHRSSLSDSGLESLGLLPLETAKITSTQQFTDRGIRALCGRRSLRTLRLDNVRLSEAGLVAISQLRGLGYLTLRNGSMPSHGLGFLAKCERLTHLTLESMEIEGMGFGAISGIQSLSSLQLSNSKFAVQQLAALKDLPNLSRLTLDGTPITDDSLSNLKSVSQLRFLNIERTNLTTAGILAALKGLKLSYVLARSDHLDDDAMQDLANRAGWTIGGNCPCGCMDFQPVRPTTSATTE